MVSIQNFFLYTCQPAMLPLQTCFCELYIHIYMFVCFMSLTENKLY